METDGVMACLPSCFSSFLWVEKQMKQWKKLRDKSSDTESINFANQNIDRIMMEAVDDLDKLN